MIALLTGLFLVDHFDWTMPRYDQIEKKYKGMMDISITFNEVLRRNSPRTRVTFDDGRSYNSIFCPQPAATFLHIGQAPMATLLFKAKPSSGTACKTCFEVNQPDPSSSHSPCRNSPPDLRPCPCPNQLLSTFSHSASPGRHRTFPPLC